MESKIPLPTDNIYNIYKFYKFYKFYALFGLLLFITSIMSVIWVGNTTNDNLHNFVKEYEALPGNEKEKEESALAKMIETRIKVQIENKEFFVLGLGGASGISALLMFYGFRQWHTKIQPKQDKYFDLQLQKLKKEVESFRNG